MAKKILKVDHETDRNIAKRYLQHINEAVPPEKIPELLHEAIALAKATKSWKGIMDVVRFVVEYQVGMPQAHAEVTYRGDKTRDEWKLFFQQQNLILKRTEDGKLQIPRKPYKLTREEEETDEEFRERQRKDREQYVEMMMGQASVEEEDFDLKDWEPY